MKLEDLSVRIFADGADLETIRKLAENKLISGFTTNPTLMRKAGVKDYAAFAQEAAKIVGPRSLSLEVFADSLDEMEKQARIITDWAENIYAKIPITNTEGVSTLPLVWRLSGSGVKVNVTAIMTRRQIEEAFGSVSFKTPSYVSVFAGRAADTGVSAYDLISHAMSQGNRPRTCEVIWASPREVWNVYEANKIRCNVITATPDILAKLPLCGRDLGDYSLETVRMFFNDAQKAGYVIA